MRSILFIPNKQCGGLLLLLLLSFFGRAQVRIQSLPTDPAARVSPVTSKYLRNVEMSNLYKELNPFSLFAPLGELAADKRYVFSAEINPLYIFSNNFRTRFNFGVGARVLARMFRTRSWPVRSPSYLPTLKLFYTLRNDPARYAFMDLSFTHHSNGQEGPARINGQWNTRNGNFSTNWFTLGLHRGDNSGRARRHYGAYVKQHAGFGDFLEQEESLKGYYGQTRIGVDVQARWIDNIRVFNPATDEDYLRYHKERWRVHGYAEFTVAGLGKYPSFSMERRINAEIRLFHFLKTLKEGGFFVGAGYYGEDPYNIFFADHYPFFRFGIAAGTPHFRVVP